MGLNNSVAPFNEFTIIQPLSNPQFGIDMNQNVSFGGTPVLIDDGGDNTGFTPAAIAGAWDFTDTTDPFSGTKSISITNANNNDEATFTNAGTTDMGSHTALTGQIKLITYDGFNNDIILKFKNNNIDVGNSIMLNNFINENVLNGYQPFVIPKSAFNITTEDIDELTITILRAAGAKPTIFFDVIQIEETGSPATFGFEPTDERLYLQEVQLFIADDATEAQTNNFNTLMNKSSLGNGILVQAFSFTEAVFAGTFHRLIDFLQVPDATLRTGTDGTNSWAQIRFDFRQHNVVLDTNGVDGVFFTVEDDLSTFLAFRTFLRLTKRL